VSGSLLSSVNYWGSETKVSDLATDPAWSNFPIQIRILESNLISTAAGYGSGSETLLHIYGYQPSWNWQQLPPEHLSLSIILCWYLESHWRKEQGPDPDPEPVSGTNPRICVRAKYPGYFWKFNFASGLKPASNSKKRAPVPHQHDASKFSTCTNI
jgi:hypothetical protein